MLMEREDAVKEVLRNLRGYLRDHLPVDVNLLSKLQDRRLLNDENADQIRAVVDNKVKKSGFNELLDYMSSYYDEEMLEKFCVFLEEYSQPARPLLSTIAKKIREELKDLVLTATSNSIEEQTPPMHPTVKDNEFPGPSGTATTLPAEEVSALNTATTSQNGDIFYPVISDLEDDFSDLATEVLELVKSLEGKKLAKLCTYLANLLKPKVPPSSPPPDVPEEFGKLKSFLISRWDPLQIRVLRGVVRHLKSDELSQQLTAYEEVMGKKIPAFLSECKTKKVSYKRLRHYSTVAVTIDYTPSEISLSRILELKQFLVSKLGLGEEHFEGFSDGSTILYFSIPKDSVWCLPACLHPSNLPQLEELKVVSLSVEGLFTIDLVEKRIVDVSDKVQDVPSHSAGPHRDVKGKGKMTRVSSPPVMPPAVLPTQHTSSPLPNKIYQPHPKQPAESQQDVSGPSGQPTAALIRTGVDKLDYSINFDIFFETQTSQDTYFDPRWNNLEPSLYSTPTMETRHTCPASVSLHPPDGAQFHSFQNPNETVKAGQLGVGELFPCNYSPSDLGGCYRDVKTTPVGETDLKCRKKYNKASRISRKRRKQNVEELEDRAKELWVENEDLKGKVAQLESEIGLVREQLLQFLSNKGRIDC